MFNTTNICSTSSASASTYGPSHTRTATNHHLGPEQADNLGYGLGRLARGGVDYLANWWQSYWNTPSQEQLAMDKQVKIFHFRIERFVSEFHSALNKIDKDPKNAKAHKEIESIASILETVSPPNESQDLQDFQNSKFDGLKQRISKMQLPTEVVNKLKSTSPVWFQNMKSAEDDSKKGQEKKLDSHRVKKHERPGKKKAAQQQQIRNAEGPSKASAKAAKEKKDEKASMNPSQIPKNTKMEGHSNDKSRQVPNSPLSFNLDTPDPTKFFTLANPISIMGAGYSFSIAGIGDVNNDGIADFAIADPYATSPGGLAETGKVWIIYGGSNVNSVDLSNLLSSQGLVIYGPQQLDRMGSSIVGLGDFNGDGKDDVAFGAVNAAAGQLSSNVIVLFGPVQNPTDLTTCDGQKCFIINGISNVVDVGLGSIGLCLAGGKDINGDKIPDLLVGASLTGQFFGIFGGPGPWSQFNLTQLTGPNGFVGNGGGLGTLGCPITMGNMQHNSIASFAVGAQRINDFFVFNGRNGDWPGQLNFPLDFFLDGSTEEGFAAKGQSSFPETAALSIGGDFDQDGNTDIQVTTLGSDVSSSALYDIYRQPNPPLNTSLNLGVFNGANGGIFLEGPQFGSEFGATIALIDINNDGNLDMAVGMPGYTPNSGPTSAGGILFILGQSGGLPPQLNLASSNLTVIVSGVTENGGNGNLGEFGLANLGDINGDGLEDLGATAVDRNSGIATVYVLLGQPPPASTNSPTNSPTNSTTNSTTPSSSNTGAIVGGVIGGVALVATAITITIIWAKKRGFLARKEEELPSRMQQNQYFGSL